MSLFKDPRSFLQGPSNRTCDANRACGRSVCEHLFSCFAFSVGTHGGYSYVTSRLHLNKVMALAIQNICMPPFVPALCIELGHYLLYREWITQVSCKCFLAVER